MELDEGLELVTSPDATIASVTHAAVETEPEADEELDDASEGGDDAPDAASDDSEDSSDSSDGE